MAEYYARVLPASRDSRNARLSPEASRRAATLADNPAFQLVAPRGRHRSEAMNDHAVSIAAPVARLCHERAGAGRSKQDLLLDRACDHQGGLTRGEVRGVDYLCRAV